MLIGKKSEYYYKLTKSKEKMNEYFVPKEEHISIPKNIDDMFIRTISILGDYCVSIINEDKDNIHILSEDLSFCAKFFEAYINSEINIYRNDYMKLITSATYYFCDKVGNSILLVDSIKNIIDIEAGGLENLLICIIKNEYSLCENIVEELSNNKFIRKYIEIYKNSIQEGSFNNLIQLVEEYRIIIYKAGTPRELLLIDIISAILKIKIERFSIVALPRYTNIDLKLWRETLENDNFIKELWSSQLELGNKGVFRGNSAVIQMPTSSGKTKSIEIIIRTVKIRKKTKLSIIVTPFRALCRELSLELENSFRNESDINICEISEVLRNDFEENHDSNFTVLIVTPEKLMYLIRKIPNIIKELGVVIFDEAHLFDDSSRGANYELLVTMLKTYLSNDIQKIVISAILSNAKTINEWINGTNGEVVESSVSLGGDKSIAFIERTLNSKNQFSLHFVEDSNINKENYYVPKIVNRIELKKIGRERKVRYFPSDDSINGDISISIANRLCINGGVAIFCGKKDSARTIVKRVLEIEERGVDITSFLKVSNQDEVREIYNLFKENLGEDNAYSMASKKGVFSHHGNIPEGIKSAIEFAMRNNKIKVVVCTSTLAQGVNLPIRYLLVPTIYQAREEIKVRDFHNLIGRTGRAGIYTEGSIIFTEPEIYNKRNNRYIGKGWKWSRYEYLINKSNSEPCESYIFEIIKYKEKNEEWFNYIIEQCTQNDINDVSNTIIRFIDSQDWEQSHKDDFKHEIFLIINIIKELENFILFVITEDESESIDNIKELIENTFAYYLGNEEQKVLLKEITMKIYQKIKNGVSDPKRQRIYGRTMLSLSEINIIEQWIVKNIGIVEDVSSISELIKNIFPLIIQIIESSKIIKKVEKIESLTEMYNLWIDGMSYYGILLYSKEKDYKIKNKCKLREFNIDEIIEICNNLFGYKTSIIISAIQEILQSYELENELIYTLLDELSRRTRYGVSSLQEVILYELGFNDRFIVNGIYNILGITTLKKSMYKIHLKIKKRKIEEFLSSYPSIFMDNLTFIIKK